MATPQSQQETTLQLKRTFAAPRARVFRAWTDAKQFAQWFMPSAEYKTIVTELDLRAKGRFTLEMHHNSGRVSKLSCTYREIKAPEKLVFTWNYVGNPAPHESLVTVEFRDLGASTEVALTHEQLANAEEREKHNHGWMGCFEQFAKYLA